MVLERRQGRHSPRPDLGTVASLAISLEQRDGLPMRADLILYILLREIRASERPELVKLRWERTIDLAGKGNARGFRIVGQLRRCSGEGYATRKFLSDR
jgi:hypothetical protein